MSTDNKILFTLKAQEDLNGIFDYIYNNLYSPQAARRIMRLIDDSINRLADFPMSFDRRFLPCSERVQKACCG